MAQAFELDDPSAFFERVPEIGLALDLGRGWVRGGPVPRRRGADRSAGVGDQQQAAGRIDDIGERLDDAIAERRGIGT
jgi:hypothetical protein